MVKALNIDDVKVVGGPLVLASAAEVDALESRLWIKFPSGYRDYVERLGEGTLGGAFVRIYPPWRIEKELVEWRRRIHKYWFWDETLELLPKERAVECVIVGDTLSGDELIFHPWRPDRLLVLPRDAEGALEAGSNLLEAIEWMCSSGQLAEQFSEREFEPHNTRTMGRGALAAGTEADRVIDPDGESLDDIVELGRLWVERHSARVWGQSDSDALERWAGNLNTTAELLFEGIVLTDNSSFVSDGYVRKYSIIDAQSKTKLGAFQISQSDGSTGYSYVPDHATFG